MNNTSIRRFQFLGLAACLCIAPAAFAAITIQTVPVGNPGNSPDYRFMQDGTIGYGQVNYGYSIDKFDVTAGQYTAFLNAIAGIDTYGLYYQSMENAPANLGCGIFQTGGGTPADPYVYLLDPNFANRPVTWVSFWDACRFANWLSNGQPSGPENAATTEDGTYTLTPAAIANNTVTRNIGATWAVTSENEWYKAAFYNPSDGTFFHYATASNSAPGVDLADPLGNNANYETISGPYPINSPYFTTPVGLFQNSASPYGTFDQSGNVSEWNDTIINGSNRGIRGGSFGSDLTSIQSDSRGGYDPNYHYISLGFRVSEVPEPTSMLFVTLGTAGLIYRRRNPR